MNVIGSFATLAWLFMGCGGHVGGGGSRAQGTSDAAAVAPGRGGMEDGGLLGVSPSDAGPTDDRASPAPDLAQGPAVWVGQSDKEVTWPPGYDGGPAVPATGYPRTGPHKVVLILDAKTNPVIGTITFGEVGPPPPSSDPKQPYPPAPKALQEPNGQLINLLVGNWTDFPFAGFSYSLVDSTLSGNLLHLSFVPSQLWQGWCTIQNSTTQDASVSSDYYFRPCVCDGGACTALGSPVRELTLTVSGDTMQGQLLLPTTVTPYAVTPPQIKLQRVQ
jgi:hypothetical protein